MATNGAAKVNRPTNTKEKEADVNRKLQFYGIASAFQNGKVPSVCLLLSNNLSFASVSNNASRTTKSMSP